MRKTLMFCLALWMPGPLPCTQEAAQTIRVSVEMVSLPVVVTTRDGKRVAGLVRDDFQVFENRVQQTIEAFSDADEPYSVALMLDTSGSAMLKLDRIQFEANRFVNMLKPQDSVAILSVAEDVTLQQDFTTDRTRASAAIRRAGQAGGA